jgi:hypothetical protein
MSSGVSGENDRVRLKARLERPRTTDEARRRMDMMNATLLADLARGICKHNTVPRCFYH